MNSAPRMAAFYSLMFAGTGVALPFAGLWFGERGLSGAEIGVIFAVPMLARLVTGPLVALWADSFRLRRTPIMVLAAAATAAYAALAFSQGFAVQLILWFVAASCAGAIIPLADVLTMKRAGKEGFNFGWPRGAGSLAFIVANVAMGALLVKAPVDAVMVWVVAATALVALAAAFLPPAEPVHEAGPVSRADRFRGLGRLVADPIFMTAIVAVGLIQAAHAFYYGFSTLTWKAEGIPESLTGLLWATGVAAEIVFMWFLEPWRRKVGPWALLMLGGGAAVVRWTAMAFAPPLALLWPLQLLHALTFAASFLAGLQILERLAPPESASAAQVLSSALSAGVLIGLATVFSGPLFDAYGALGYLSMAVLALLGLLAGWRLRPALVQSPSNRAVDR